MDMTVKNHQTLIRRIYDRMGDYWSVLTVVKKDVSEVRLFTWSVYALREKPEEDITATLKTALIHLKQYKKLQMKRMQKNEGNFTATITATDVLIADIEKLIG